MINVFFFLLFSFPIRRRVGHAHWPCVSPATWPTPRRLFAISAGAPVRNFSLGRECFGGVALDLPTEWSKQAKTSI
ncbi:hypothetical protein T02_8576 [Trichinella nativa]|uniref:Secreted protein n=3 Tax=Trichinella TaxID=6333 RepID=A0A0V1LN50_9BILA|nr:hypothetical protein T05_7863 [Trichinella murrelli]KRY22016.1 hypothetical protein T12_2282 [Trichinella patagoniensis]KRZ60943.1 hypothetical protein T02_8576 [Trichinella nativa]